MTFDVCVLQIKDNETMASPKREMDKASYSRLLYYLPFYKPKSKPIESSEYGVRFWYFHSFIVLFFCCCQKRLKLGDFTIRF